MIDYHDYLGDKVKIVDIEGDIFIGEAMSYDVWIDIDKEYDEIGIYYPERRVIIVIPVNEIVSIERLED
ncbi:MAG: hypothetical protein ATN35_03615 [Epulopiscium sp. Nele67-Bin004]|nr:MAG: hypothetical protein ATN35_03615 [Epulopiscium sp. Nele67-Bin004]